MIADLRIEQECRLCKALHLFPNALSLIMLCGFKGLSITGNQQRQNSWNRLVLSKVDIEATKGL